MWLVFVVISIEFGVWSGRGLGWITPRRVWGSSAGTGQRWFRQAGGVMPAEEKPGRRRRWLTIDEREQILAGIERGTPSGRSPTGSIGRRQRCAGS